MRILFCSSDGVGDLVLRHLRNRVADYAQLLGWLTDSAVLRVY